MVGPIYIAVVRDIYEKDDLIVTPNCPTWVWTMPVPGQVLAVPLQCALRAPWCFEIAPPMFRPDERQVSPNSC